MDSLCWRRRTHGQVLPGANKIGDEQRPFGAAPVRRQGMTGRREFFYSIKKEGTPASFQA
jgi:hypothetical protein